MSHLLRQIKGASPFEPAPEKEGKDVKPLPGFIIYPLV